MSDQDSAAHKVGSDAVQSLTNTTNREHQVRKRKPRPQLSCAECRRLKLKCDRQGWYMEDITGSLDSSLFELCPSQEGRALSGQGNPADKVGAHKDFYNLHLVSPNGKIHSNETIDKLGRRRLSNSGANSTKFVSKKFPACHQGSATTEIRESSLSSLTVTNNGQWPRNSSIDDSTVTNKPYQKTSGYQNDFSHNPLRTQRAATPSTHDDSRFVKFDFTHSLSPSTSIPELVALPEIYSRERNACDSGDDPSYGTLVISDSGRSKYLGPTAASEWLKDQEIVDSDISRAQSPTPLGSQTLGGADGSFSSFPFAATVENVGTKLILSKLPALDEACVFVNSFYRYFAWHFDVSPRETFQPIFDRVYSQLECRDEVKLVATTQEYALNFITMALGALHDLELPPNDPISEELFAMSKACLVKGNFLTHNTLAGVRTLHIMAHYCLQTEQGRNGDSAWPLWGLTMRIIQAMGLHRDGERWNLSADLVEERRRVFWECHSADIFQANCFSRPSIISPDHIDTAFPAEQTVRGYSTLKFELSHIAGAVLDFAMKVRAPPYSTVIDLHDKLCNFERDITFGLRCRTVLLAMPSRYPTSEQAIRDSPEESKRDVHKTFQQFTLALNVCEALLCLHRPYYVKALHERLSDPTSSHFGQSYLTVVERCHVIIQIVTRIYTLHPNISSRHWNFWHHAFNAAICLGTLVLENPQNCLADFALSQIDSAINLYTAVVQGRTSNRMINNLQWLLRLRQRALDARGKDGNVLDLEATAATVSNAGEQDMELLGWRTRLVQRASQGAHTATTISSDSKRGGEMVFQHASPSPTSFSTEALLQQFWEPLLHQDMSNSSWTAFL